MTDLSKLKVSLTKHGAHKVLKLLEHFPPNKVLKNTWDKYKGIKISQSQARRVLSAFADDRLPGFWRDAKSRDRDTLRHLVFLGIAFSHSALIDALKKGSAGDGTGTIKRSQLGGGKAFTNFKNDLEELGLATHASASSVTYDLNQVLANSQLGDLAAQLIALKLDEAGWSGTPALADEAIALGFHRTMSCSEADFRSWLSDPAGIVREEDELSDTADADEEAAAAFKFQAGHTPKKVGTVAKTGTKNASARLIHNEIQSVLFDLLVAERGKGNVGTELNSGSRGTSVDLVVRNGTDHEFYEIKTSPSFKKCVRQALSQLIEYAYWPAAKRASKLVIVAEAKITKDGKRYVEHVRAMGIPLYYRQIDRAAKTLSAEM